MHTMIHGITFMADVSLLLLHVSILTARIISTKRTISVTMCYALNRV
jgi:hypothetical protein